MVGIGKTYQNLMVDVQQTNEKLRLRAQNIVIEATGCTSDRAKELLDSSKGEVKAAIIMQLLDIDYENAKRKLTASEGIIRSALEHSQKDS